MQRCPLIGTESSGFSMVSSSSRLRADLTERAGQSAYYCCDGMSVRGCCAHLVGAQQPIARQHLGRLHEHLPVVPARLLVLNLHTVKCQICRLPDEVLFYSDCSSTHTRHHQARRDQLTRVAFTQDVQGSVPLL